MRGPGKPRCTAGLPGFTALVRHVRHSVLPARLAGYTAADRDRPGAQEKVTNGRGNQGSRLCRGTG